MRDAHTGSTPARVHWSAVEQDQHRTRTLDEVHGAWQLCNMRKMPFAASITGGCCCDMAGPLGPKQLRGLIACFRLPD